MLSLLEFNTLSVSLEAILDCDASIAEVQEELVDAAASISCFDEKLATAILSFVMGQFSDEKAAATELRNILLDHVDPMKDMMI